MAGASRIYLVIMAIPSFEMILFLLVLLNFCKCVLVNEGGALAPTNLVDGVTDIVADSSVGSRLCLVLSSPRID